MPPQGLDSQGKHVPASEELSWAQLRSSVVSFGHYHPGYQCGICGQLLTVGYRCVGLIGNPTSTSTWLVTRPFLYPDYLHGPHAVDGWALCRQAACGPCSRSPESCAVHFDCYEVFRQRYPLTDSMDRLWVAACWRKPWPGAPRLVLPEHYALGLEAVAEVGEKYGLKFMGQLPPEIVQMIRGFCDTSLFWKLASALDFCHRLHATSMTDITTIPLNQIISWQRHCDIAIRTTPDPEELPDSPDSPDSADSPGSPIATDLPELPPFILLTIDSRGLSRIDRIESEISNDTLPRDNESYIIQDGASCEDIEAVVKDGQLRLKVPEGQTGLQLWNSLAQHRPSDGENTWGPRWHMLGSVPHASWFTTIDLRGTTGLTFFTSGGIIYAVHAHSSRKPVAVLPSGCVPEYNKKFLTWVYVPVAPGDQIEEIAFRGQEVGLARPHCIVLRLKIAGAVSVGSLPTSDSIVTFASSPTSLAYGKKEMDRIHAIGAYSSIPRSEWPMQMAKDGVIELPNLRRTVYGIHVNDLARANTSIAPMENVKTVRIYQRPQPSQGGWKKNCGMVLDYRDGSRRAVGECRVGVDDYYDIVKPICLRISNRYRVGAGSGDTRSLVEFYDEIPKHMDRFVPYYHMVGTLVIRFRHNESTFWAEILESDRILRKAEV